MTNKNRIHQPRSQTPAQEAAELAIRQRFGSEKPSLEALIQRGDIAQVFTMGEYWELRKTLSGLRALREQKGLSVADMAEKTGLDGATITHLESGHIDNPPFATLTRYAKALGKRIVVSLVDVVES